MSPILMPYRRLVLCVAVLASAGCGVSDYEARMQEAEVRIQRIDKENELLGGPLEIPLRPDAPLAVFLRPPRGVGSISRKDEFPYHYPATTGLCTDVYVAIAEGPAKVKKLIEETFEAPSLTWQAVTVNPPDRKAINFEAVEFIDPRSPPTAPVSCQAYVHGSVGVLFRFLTSNRQNAMPSLQMSMETYAEGSDAQTARTEFNKRKVR